MPKAQVIHVKGGPENFVWEDIVIPPPGPGEVHIRTQAIGVNFADIYHRAGTPHPLVVGDPPIIVGNESVATVLAVGPGVDAFKAGDKVATCQPPIGA
ncbi:MAG: alcohol dehydrogenase catalytic domain-containing protein [Hyphomicrobiaceae bacterium]